MDEYLEEAYLQGWMEASQWAQRDDLKADTDSAAYKDMRDFRLRPIKAFLNIMNAKKDQNNYKIAYEEWLRKTEFIQEWMNKGIISAKYLGWHRADIMRDLIHAAYKQGKGK